MPRKMPDVARRPATPQEKSQVSISIDWLLERCEVDQQAQDACWVWKLTISGSGQPKCRITISPKVSATLLVRRLVAKLKGVTMNEDVFVRARPSCQRGCCRPSHLVAMAKEDALALHAESMKGIPHSEERKAKSAANRAKIPVYLLEEIMSSPEPGEHVSRRNGLNKSYASKIRRGLFRKRDIAKINPATKNAKGIKLAPTNPFAQLLNPLSGPFQQRLSDVDYEREESEYDHRPRTRRRKESAGESHG